MGCNARQAGGPVCGSADED